MSVPPARWPDPRRSLLVARTELRRSARAFAASRTRLVATAFAAVVVSLAVGVAGIGARAVGEGLVTGDVRPEVARRAVRTGVAMAWAGLLVFAVARTVGKRGDVDGLDGLLTTVPARDVAGGVLLSEAALVVGWTAVPVGTLVGSLALGAGTPLPAVTAVPVVLAVVVTALPLGYAVGLWFRQAVLTRPRLARHRSKIGAGLVLVYLIVVTSREAGTGALALAASLQGTPVGWLGDFLAASLPGVTVPTARTAAAPVVAAAVGAAAVVLATWSARVHWHADRARVDEGTLTTESRLDTRLAGVVSRPTRAVAAVAWRRTARAPIRLLYLVYPLFGLATVFAEAARAGTVPAYLPPLILLYGAWAAGAAFTLNPLGDLGATLPVALTTPAGGRALVGGRLLVGVGVGAPLVALGTAAVGLASPLPLATTAALSVAALVAVPGATALAAGVGVVLPRFGAVSVTSNRQAVIPSKGAFLAYSAILLVGAGAVGLLVRPAYRVTVAGAGTILSSAPLTPSTVAVIASLVAAGIGVAAALSYRYAVRRVGAYRL